ncbi:MAG: glutamate-5-semialdehyde dehydrogenase [Dehalococcoidia bacterium]|nr:glutamate-5-semialdehyde dehydrogenase [Dehalococcoidia bacterium]
MKTNTVEDLLEQGRDARAASRILARLSSNIKNQALLNIAEALETQQDEVLEANEIDHRSAQSDGLSEAMLDRLLLTGDRLLGTAAEVRGVAALPDPIAETMDMTTMSNGLKIGKKRVPLGVIGSIYESRPHVTIDISALCLKSGNACMLRGGKESLRSNTALAKLVRKAIGDAGVPEDAVQFVDNPDRSLVDAMLGMKDHIDLLIPRGGDGLIRFVAENATMPAVTGGIGVCHTYIDRGAELDMAARIVFNAKTQRPSVCNALDTILVHVNAAPACLPRIVEELTAAGVELHCDHRALSILGPQSTGGGESPGGKILPANEEDWGREFLSMTAAVKIVDSLDDALDHIETYGSGHSEAIITEDYSAAMRFLDEVDAAAVFVNASTRFNDGGQFGLGAEVGISTQKFHARGPMGLKELTSYKWVIMGDGQVRE